jgi:hypothetical protein
MRTFHTSLVALLSSAGIAAAQCQFTTLTQQVIGSGCNIGFIGCCAVLPITPTFLPTLDPQNCELDIFVPAIEGCCGVTVPGRVLVLGTQQGLVPLPDFGFGCELHVMPSTALLTTADTFSLPLPPSLPPITLMAQAGYFSVWTQGAGSLSTFVITDARSLALQ